MRILSLLFFLFFLAACSGPTETTVSASADGPDRASAAADGGMILTPSAIQPVTVFTYEDIIWGFCWLPDGRILATDKAGKLLVINEQGQATPVGSGVPTVRDHGQGGLMDVLLDRDFANNRLVYLSYSMPGANDSGVAATAVGRGRLSDDATALENFTVLYAMDDKTDKGQHYGSRLAWGPNDGHLYFTIGDRGDRDNNPQDTTRDGGKVYRIAADGSIPADNPFVDYPKAKTAIFSYGHRNPQSLTFHPETGELWETEHGPRGGDEINIIEKGKNYGWPVISYGINYNGTQFTDKVAQDGMEQPLHYWVPSIAPSGMAFVTGDRYPGWKGDLLVGSLKFMRLQHVQLNGKEVVGEQKLINNLGRVRDVRMGPDDYIYASVEGEGIVRLEVQ
ncbi:PQQ-dependent sugar dehydrogenase [Neolewinella lacunae]|uniref:PQQ-dependent sugar dehydrogenase n=1 Tax=Neolewinella lacunae TaxID=1517758 RepID=A0A923T859_9BACT|nr:PQQ-dependent sugar dehydrogenase [Neolewinella lacunae]MBC6993613.1 PQQ-dependent sugar dehydrogenase [Neolewinella lacunae]MDN3635519.1 PQQ-dependent sugar dehydrogenase [Neolewinella lacunae]